MKSSYSVAVSFEALSANINVYEMIRIENQISIPIEIEQEIRVPSHLLVTKNSLNSF